MPRDKFREPAVRYRDKLKGLLPCPICCVCGLIRDEDRTSGQEYWVTKQVYWQTHNADPSDCRLTHTYCPSCYTQFMNRIAAA
jgi:hypothetical protein